MLLISATDEWRIAHPGAIIGLLELSGVENTHPSLKLDERKREIDVSREGDQITQMNGATKAIRAGDMIMRDANGVSCSILYGQDNRSPISSATTHVLYVAYAPVGVPAETVEAQLEKIKENVRLFSPMVIVEQQRLVRA